MHINFVLNFLLLVLLWFYLCNIGSLQFYVHGGDLIWSAWVGVNKINESKCTVKQWNVQVTLMPLFTNNKVR